MKGRRNKGKRRKEAEMRKEGKGKEESKALREEGRGGGREGGRNSLWDFRTNHGLFRFSLRKKRGFSSGPE